MKFGDFVPICNRASLPLCQVLTNVDATSYEDLSNGILPRCYARSVEMANTVIFQIGNAFANIGFLIILLIILYNIRSKYTAIGRLEMSFYYHTMLALVISTLIVDCGVSPPGSSSYPYFVALQLGLISASCWCMMICGFLGFRLWEDGSFKSLLFLRASSFLIGALTYMIAIVTFKDWITNGTMSRTNTVGLFVVAYILNALFLLIYVVLQVILALVLIRNYWVLGVIGLSVLSFITGQVFVYGVSREVCEGVKHYLDGLFFASLCNMFSVMMIYKFWDMTTDDDLEFSISVNKDGSLSYAET